MDARAEAERIVAGAEARAAFAAKEAAAAAREEEIAKLAASALALRVADERRAERDLARTIDVAVLLAERLVGEALAVDPKRIGELAAAALAETRGSRQVRIEANPADVDALREVLRELAHVATVEPSTELGRGSLVVHTDLGKIDGTLRPQLDRLTAVLRDAMAAEARA
ncbi:MAG: hypothetical protein KIT84_04530 [Labilithrix sp.]|nr:hypothetical protein [Labilithrix sp.]MCW5810252.1 hypothetical protein [Labilithrix sp.]